MITKRKHYLGENNFKSYFLEVLVDPLVEALGADQRHLLSDSGGDLVRVCLLHQFRHEELQGRVQAYQHQDNSPDKGISFYKL